MSTEKTLDIHSFNEELRNILCNYVVEKPEMHSFVLITDLGYKECNFNSNISKIILLGPAYNRLFNGGEDCFIGYPSLVMKKGNSFIFIQSSIDVLTKEKGLRRLYEEKEIVLPDSIDSYATFLTRAIAISVSKTKAVIISEKVDTILLKKEVPFIVPPIK